MLLLHPITVKKYRIRSETVLAKVPTSIRFTRILMIIRNLFGLTVSKSVLLVGNTTVSDSYENAYTPRKFGNHNHSELNNQSITFCLHPSQRSQVNKIGLSALSTRSESELHDCYLVELYGVFQYYVIIKKTECEFVIVLN